MKKQQKEDVRQGAEIARAMYQEFLKRPQWLTSFDDNKRQVAADALGDLILMETSLLDGRAPLSEEYKRTMRITALHKLQCLLRYGTTENLIQYASNN